ncbi:hypothetical protein HK099_005022 [Clydaea vesicula]|uniref:Uncharacterized protein n=1 Tax=Clydaea vesicula TaxID=447962 RepID=A0AAD5XZU8_9FUNG|nr:hypothetical protein HK099_005022 [Clydaea vesicula]
MKLKKTSAMSSQQDPVVVSQASADEFEFLDDWPGFVHLPAQDDQAPSPPRKNNQPASDSPKQVFHNYPDCDKSWLSFVVDEVKGTDLADEHCQEVEVLLDSCPPSFMDNSFDSFSSSEDSSRSCSPTSPIISDCNEFSNGFILPSNSPPQKLECESFNFQNLSLVQDKEIIFNLNKNNLHLNFLPSTPESTKKFFHQKKLNLQLEDLNSKSPISSSPLNNSNNYNKSCLKSPLSSQNRDGQRSKKRLIMLSPNSENFTLPSPENLKTVNPNFLSDLNPSEFDLALLKVAKNRVIRKSKRSLNFFNSYDKDCKDIYSEHNYDIFKRRRTSLDQLHYGTWKPLGELGKKKFSKNGVKKSRSFENVNYEEIFSSL